MAIAKRIAALSVASNELEQIKQVLERAKAQLGRSWMWTGEAEADVLLIDADSVYGHMDWLRAQANGRRIVSLTSHASDYDVPLSRPVTVDALVSALRKFEDAADAAAPRAPGAPAPRAAAPAPVAPKPAPRPAAPQPAAANPPPARPAPAPAPVVSAPQPAPVAAAPAPPPVVAPAPAPAPAKPVVAEALPLAEYCTLEALPNPARLAVGENPALTLDVGADCYYGPTALKPLLPYCQGNIKRSQWEPVSGAVLQGLRAAGGGQPISRLLWLFTLVNSNGQLLPGFDLNARYKLTKWPQIEREYPRHFRIATVMMKGAATLAEIADQSGSALADVIDFVNAYSVTGFVEPENAPSQAAVPEGSGGLLARLRARARRG